MNLKTLVSVATLALAAIAAPLAANAATVLYNVSGQSPNGAYDAQLSFDVVGGQAVSGGGTITGVGIPGTQNVTLITLATPGVQVDGGGLLGYRFQDGTDLFDLDAVVPIDGNGLLFSIGANPPSPGTGLGFAIWDNGTGNYQTFFAGKVTADSQAFYGYGTADVKAGGVPEPATWSLMIVGLGGLGSMLRRRRALTGLATA
jgi:hypothetical protein